MTSMQLLKHAGRIFRTDNQSNWEDHSHTVQTPISTKIFTNVYFYESLFGHNAARFTPVSSNDFDKHSRFVK